METNKLEIVKEFLRKMVIGAEGDTLANFYHPDAIQIEYPNLLTKVVTHRDVKELIAASESGKKVLKCQRFEIVRAFQISNLVIIEAI